MKKIFLSLIAVMATMSINAQVVKVYENGVLSATYTNTECTTVKVVMEEAPIGTGESSVSSSAGISGDKVKWVQLWANGPKWAVFNVGAKSVSEYGGYYNWGKLENQATNTDYSSKTGSIQGTTDDTATNLWGSNWQMPTKQNLTDLISTVYTDGGVWKSSGNSGYGVSGLLVTGKGDYSSNSVFFPATGYWTHNDNTLQSVGTVGNYWSSEYDGAHVYNLYFGGSNPILAQNNTRSIGLSVRAIRK